MAKRPIKLNHGEDVLKWDIPVEENAAEKHIVRVEKNKDKFFADGNMAVYKELLFQYNTFSDQFRNGTEDEQIMLLNRFHQISEFSGWIIGDFLLIVEDKIEKEHVKMTKGRYNSLRDYFEINKEYLGFGYQAGYNYIKIRKGLTFDEFKLTGIKKGLAIAAAPEELKPQLIEKVMDKSKKMTEKELQLEIANYKENINNAKKVEKQAEEKKIVKAVKYDMVTNKGGNKITIESHSFSIELMQDALNHYEMQIKAFIKKRLEDE